jgi:hypothetical protein
MTEPALARTTDDLRHATETTNASRPTPPAEEDDVLYDPEDDLLPPPKPVGSVTPIVTTLVARR